MKLRVFLVWSLASAGLGAASFLSNVMGSMAGVVGQWPLSGFYGELVEVALVGAALGWVVMLPLWLILPRWFSPLLIPVAFVGLVVRPEHDWTLVAAVCAIAILLAIAVALRHKGNRPVIIAFAASFALTLSGLFSGAISTYSGVQQLLGAGVYYADSVTDRAMQRAKPRYSSDEMPDIWWIIPDHYPSPSIMDAFGYDWSQHGLMDGRQIAQHFRAAGFALDDDAIADSPSTIKTFARMLSLTDRRATPRSSISLPENARIYINLYFAQFLNMLGRLGYWRHAEVGFAKFVQTLPFDKVTKATEVVWPRPGSLLAVALDGLVPVRYGWFPDLSDRIANKPLSGKLISGGWREKRCKSVAAQFERLRGLERKGDRPLFVLWHVYLPHDPLWFDAQGDCYPELPLSNDQIGPLHVGNAIDWLARRLPELQQAASRLGEGRPIIMLVQADEGSTAYKLGGDMPENGALGTEVKEKQHILSLSWTNMQNPPWTGSPPPLVKAWRSIFNAISDQQLDLDGGSEARGAPNASP